MIILENQERGMEKRNIVLVGMPGVGKSTAGVLLAKALKMPFIDTDLLIQERENRFLQEIINQDGLKRFLEIEEDVIKMLDMKGYVIATGGSAIYSGSSMKRLKAAGGMVVYLELGLEELEGRIKNMSERGIAIAPGKTLADLFEERTPLYRTCADVTIDCSGKDTEQVVTETANKIKP
jgi:shikimate kinase